MQVNAKTLNDTLYISLVGELDENSAGFVRENLDRDFSNTFCKQVILDLSNLSFMDSTGIGVLIGRYKKLKEKNIPIFLSNPSNHIDKILKMTAIYEIMPKLN